MDMIVLVTSAGAPFAMLGLSSPVAAHRDCIFDAHPQLTVATLKSKEGKIIFSDRPKEYACNYEQGRERTLVTFTNERGRRFEVRVARNDEGT